MLKLCLLLAVAAAHRVHELEKLDAVDESGNSKPQEGGAGINVLLVPGLEFGAMKQPVLSHQMEIKPGAPDMVMDVQETGSGRSIGHSHGRQATGYEIEVVGPNGQLQVGHLRLQPFKLFATNTKYEFQTASGTSILRMSIPNWGGMPGLAAHVTSDDQKNPYTYYTFSKDGMARMGTESFSVFKGRIGVSKGRTMGVDTPYLKAKGHFLGWKFYLAGQVEPVASMNMPDSKNSAFTSKQSYQITMKSGVDPIMLSMLVGFIDSCNNNGGGYNNNDRRRRSQQQGRGRVR